LTQQSCGDNGLVVWKDRRVDNPSGWTWVVEAIDAGRVSYGPADALDAVTRLRELAREVDRELALLQRYLRAAAGA
jgi:hypothetical protein